MRIPTIIPEKGRVLINQGSTLTLNPKLRPLETKERAVVNTAKLKQRRPVVIALSSEGLGSLGASGLRVLGFGM